MGKGMHLLVIVLLLLGVAAAGSYVYTQVTGKTLSGVGNPAATGTGQGSVGGGCAAGYVPPSGFLCANLQAQYFVFDPLVPAGTGNGINGAQVSVSNSQTLASVDVPSTTASTGLVTGAYYFITGNSYVSKISTTNYVTQYLPLFVPPISNTAQQVTTINIPLPEVKLDTWTWAATGPAGTTWSSSYSTYNFAAQSTTQASFVFTVATVTNNQGYLSSYDPFNKVQNLAVWEFSSPSSPATTVQGCQFSYTKNNVVYCQYVLPDGFTTINPSYSQGSSAVSSYFPKTQDGRYTSAQPVSQTVAASGVAVTGALSQQFAGTTIYAGTLSFGVTFNKGSLGSGSTEVWTGKLWLYADILYFDGGGGYNAAGGYGGDQSQATLSGGNSPSFTFQN